jgi:hypothetical protein
MNVQVSQENTTPLPAPTDPFSPAAFVDSAQRLAEKQRRLISQATTQYQIERTELVDRWRVKLEQLRADSADELRRFDDRWLGKLNGGKSVLDMLERLRPGE